MIKRDLFGAPIKIKLLFSSVSFSIFTDYTAIRANGMVSEWSCKNQNSSYRGKFHQNFDQGKSNLVLVSEEFELSELELTD